MGLTSNTVNFKVDAKPSLSGSGENYLKIKNNIEDKLGKNYDYRQSHKVEVYKVPESSKLQMTKSM